MNPNIFKGGPLCRQGTAVLSSVVLIFSFFASLLYPLNIKTGQPKALTSFILQTVPPLELEQKGDAIHGIKAMESLGWSSDLSYDGNVVVVGSRNAYEISSQQHNIPGRVSAYRWNGNSWGTAILDKSGNQEIAEERVGESVSLSGDGQFLAVGAPGIFERKGEVWIFNLNSANINTPTKILSGHSANSEFGNVVSFSFDGHFLAIAARRDSENGHESGAVRVYKKVGSHNSLDWIQIGSTIVDNIPGNMSGWSIALSGDGNRIAVGSCTGSPSSSYLGFVRVYQLDPCSEEWIPIGEDITEEALGQGSAYSLTTNYDGSIIAIGEPFYNDKTGRVRLFEYDNNSTWSNQAILQAVNPTSGSEFGFSVSLSDLATKLIVGSRTSNENVGLNTGRTSIFERDGSNWMNIKELPGDSHNIHSGRSVAVSGNGQSVAIGDSRYKWGSGMHFHGRLRVFDLSE